MLVNNRSEIVSICREKLSSTKKIKANQTETKMNNDVCIISIKVKILSKWVS